MIAKHTCGQCLLYKYNGSICPIFQEERKKDDMACPKYASVLYTCSICGSNFVDSVTISENSYPPLILCPTCASATGTCKVCARCDKCALAEDKSEPQTVQQQIKTNNGYVVTNVLNPVLVEKHCQSCKCFDKENFICWKQNAGTCGNYNIKEGKL